MIKVKYSILCDYCNKVFYDNLNVSDFESHELPFKFQEAKNTGWVISPEGGYSGHVLCNECMSKGVNVK